MNTNTLVTQTAKILDLPKEDVKKVVKKVFELIVGAIKQNDKVRIESFGTFVVRITKERSGRNMKTGEQIIIPSRKKIKFRPTKNLRWL